jgi:hypothetical protein
VLVVELRRRSWRGNIDQTIRPLLVPDHLCISSTVDAQRARQKFALTARPLVKPVQNEEQDLRGELPMTDLVVIAFPTEAKAEEVRQKLLKMQKEYLIELGDAAIAVKDAQGHIKLNQLINTTKAGAVGGTFGVR